MTLHPKHEDADRPGRLAPQSPVAGFLRSASPLEGDTLRKQLEAIVRYARDQDLQLVRLYCDELGYGVRIDGRSGLQQMFRDIEGGEADFDALLLLDPGHSDALLDPNDVAALEYLCLTGDIEIHYCAEGRSENKIRVSATVESIERATARECARELADPGQPRAGPSHRRIASGVNENPDDRSTQDNGVSDDATRIGHPRPSTE